MVQVPVEEKTAILSRKKTAGYQEREMKWGRTRRSALLLLLTAPEWAVVFPFASQHGMAQLAAITKCHVHHAVKPDWVREQVRHISSYCQPPFTS